MPVSRSRVAEQPTEEQDEDDESPADDEQCESVVDEEDPLEKDPQAKRAHARLEEVMQRFEAKWSTGLYEVSIHRDYPLTFGAYPTSGHIGTVRHGITRQWLSDTCGGGTYHVSVGGPVSTKEGKTRHSWLAHVTQIKIAGHPYPVPDILDTANSKRINKRLTLKIVGEGGALEEPPSPAVQVAGQSSSNPLVDRLVEENLAHARKLETLLLQQTQKESQFSTDKLIQLFTAIARPAEGGAPASETIRASLEKARDDHARELRELSTRYESRIEALERDHKSQIEASLREVRATHDNHLETVRESYKARIALLEERAASLQSDLASARSETTSLRTALEDARFGLMKAEATKPGEIESFGKLARMVNQVRDLNAVLSPAAAVAAAEPEDATSKLINMASDGTLERLVTTVLNRGRPAPPPPPAPETTQQASQAWQAYRQQTARPPQIQGAAPQAQEQSAEQAAQTAMLDDLVQAIEQAVERDEPKESFVDGLLVSVPRETVAALAAMDQSTISALIDSLDGLSVAGKRYARGAARILAQRSKERLSLWGPG